MTSLRIGLLEEDFTEAGGRSRRRVLGTADLWTTRCGALWTRQDSRKFRPTTMRKAAAVWRETAGSVQRGASSFESSKASNRSAQKIFMWIVRYFLGSWRSMVT